LTAAFFHENNAVIIRDAQVFPEKDRACVRLYARLAEMLTQNGKRQ
jgi:hypothetical protein